MSRYGLTEWSFPMYGEAGLSGSLSLRDGSYSLILHNVSAFGGHPHGVNLDVAGCAVVGLLHDSTFRVALPTEVGHVDAGAAGTNGLALSGTVGGAYVVPATGGIMLKSGETYGPVRAWTSGAEYALASAGGLHAYTTSAYAAHTAPAEFIFSHNDATIHSMSKLGEHQINVWTCPEYEGSSDMPKLKIGRAVGTTIVSHSPSFREFETHRTAPGMYKFSAKTLSILDDVDAVPGVLTPSSEATLAGSIVFREDGKTEVKIKNFSDLPAGVFVDGDIAAAVTRAPMAYTISVPHEQTHHGEVKFANASWIGLKDGILTVLGALDYGADAHQIFDGTSHYSFHAHEGVHVLGGADAAGGAAAGAGAAGGAAAGYGGEGYY